MSNTKAQKIIERIYITKGDNLTNEEGLKCDKMVGVVVDGAIHWMDYGFATLDELSGWMGIIGISMNSDGKWGVQDEDGCATLDQRVTKIRHHHDDLWLDKYSYKKRTKLNRAGKTFWDWCEFRDTYLNNHQLRELSI